MARLPDHISGSDADAGVSLLQQVKARFASSPAVHAEFFGLLARFGKGNGEIADIRAVVDSAYALLRGHPDLVQRFDAFNPFLCRPGQHEAESTREDRPTRPRRERRRSVVVDADCAGPMQFLDRVKLAGAGLYDRVLAMLIHVQAEEALDANEIYKKAREVFGTADSNLLRGFTEYLPTGRDFLRRHTMKEPSEEHRAPAAKRKAPATAAAPAIPTDGPSKKKPRVDKRKTTNRRPSPVVDGSKSGGVFVLREWWEFETTYSKLAVTLRRTEKALEKLKPKKELSEEVEVAKESPEHRGRLRTFEELYPDPKCQEVLREMYGGMFGSMREALEDSARTELALKTILHRLRKLERLAVKMAMGRRDPARIKGWIYKRVVDWVVDLKERTGASDHGGTCAPPADVWHDVA